MDLKQLSIEDARLVQIGLQTLGFYSGTTQGLPGHKTLQAYERYMGAHDGNLIDILIEIAESQVGVKEIPRNSNRGPMVESYQAATSERGSGWPYCAAFVCWCIREAGKKVALPFARPTTALAFGFEEWGRKAGLAVVNPDKDPKIRRGDIVIFEFSHIGIAVGNAKRGKVETVEANTDANGSRDGGGVYRKTRNLSLLRSYIRLS